MNYSFFERQFADKVFGALDGIETGALTLITPDGRTRTFEGRKDGPTAHLHVHRWQVFSNLIARKMDQVDSQTEKSPNLILLELDILALLYRH